ncbi:MAG: transcription antitermination factor NusB [Thermoanaerobaculia bacterium]
MTKRRRGREMALQMLYQSEFGALGASEVLARYDAAERTASEREESGPGGEPLDADQVREAFEYARFLVTGTLERRADIDQLIAGQAEHWRLERMPAVDRNILRLAVFELLVERDVPKVVVLDEAIELAKKYGGEQSGAFVNGLLDGLLKAQAFPGRMT